MFNLPFAGLGIAHVDRSESTDALTRYWNNHGQTSDSVRDSAHSAVSDFFGSLLQPLEDRVLNNDSNNYLRNFIAENPDTIQAIIDGELSFDSLFDSLLDSALGGLPDSVPNNAPSLDSYGLEPETFNYLNAELAKFYGMDRNTAYQEALANTSYQRAVKDMQAAGLNPAAIFGNGRGSTASGVGYIGSAGAASSFGSGYRSSSKLFSSEDYGLIASLAGLATAVVTKRPSNFWLGQQGAQAVMSVLNGIDRKFNR